MVAVRRHAWLRGYSRAVSLIPLHVVLVCQSLCCGVHGHVWHVASWHMRVLGHGSAALLRHVLLGRLIGRINLIASIDAVFVAGCGLRSIETGLG